MKIHIVFYFSLLELAADNRYLGQVQTPQLPMFVNGDEEYKVEDILNSRA